MSGSESNRQGVNMKEYIVHTTSYGGSVDHKCFTNKREAKSFAWKWINEQKYIHRTKTNDRDYAELKAYITVYTGDDFNSQECVAYYD